MKIIKGDCIEQMKLLPENSVDAIVTDPPYGLGFMNKEWDSPAKHRELVEREKKRSEERKAEGKSPTDAPFSQSVQPGLAIKGAKENRWFQKWSEEWSKEAIRVLKPGGYMLVCCATRMYHRMTCGIEDAGFEIRDTIMWLYGSGFPKSLNIGKQIDKINGVEQEQIEYEHPQRKNRSSNYSIGFSESEERKNEGGSKIMKGIATSEEAKEWEGWGTALKPACEPIVVARKPLSEKNVALNVLKWGTGGINIDECRIGFINQDDEFESKNKNQHSKYPNSIMRNPAPNGIYHQDKREPEDYTATGRFPANVILECTCDETETAEEKISGGFGAMKIGMSDTGKGITQEYDSNKSLSKQGSYTIHTNPNCPCKILDEQTEGKVGNGHWSKTKTYGYGNFGNYCSNKEVGKSEYFGVGEKDKSKHGASRFFYCAKASKSERNFGCEDMPLQNYLKENKMGGEGDTMLTGSGNPRDCRKHNNHPTVKPIKLMEYLIKLVSREGATILDPFLGSGTTLLACYKLNRNGIGIEKEEEYIKIAQARLNKLNEQTKLSA